MAAVAPDEVAGHQDVEGDHHRHHGGDGEDQGAEGQGDDEAAEAGDGFYGVGEEDEYA